MMPVRVQLFLDALYSLDGHPPVTAPAGRRQAGSPG